MAHQQSNVFAGIRWETVETERAWHARQLVAQLAAQQLGSYDGIVAVSVCTIFFPQNLLGSILCTVC